jgi:hypothetical protein
MSKAEVLKHVIQVRLNHLEGRGSQTSDSGASESLRGLTGPYQQFQ